MQGIVEVKETLSELGVIDDMTLDDLKWFYKQCAEGEGDSVLPIEDIIKQVQKRFLELQEKKSPVKKDFLNITHVEAMLIINQKHLEMHKGKIAKLKREKEV